MASLITLKCSNCGANLGEYKEDLFQCPHCGCKSLVKSDTYIYAPTFVQNQPHYPYVPPTPIEIDWKWVGWIAGGFVMMLMTITIPISIITKIQSSIEEERQRVAAIEAKKQWDAEQENIEPRTGADISGVYNAEEEMAAARWDLKHGKPDEAKRRADMILRFSPNSSEAKACFMRGGIRSMKDWKDQPETDADVARKEEAATILGTTLDKIKEEDERADSEKRAAATKQKEEQAARQAAVIAREKEEQKQNEERKQAERERVEEQQRKQAESYQRVRDEVAKRNADRAEKQREIAAAKAADADILAAISKPYDDIIRKKQERVDVLTAELDRQRQDGRVRIIDGRRTIGWFDPNLLREEEGLKSFISTATWLKNRQLAREQGASTTPPAWTSQAESERNIKLNSEHNSFYARAIQELRAAGLDK